MCNKKKEIQLGMSFGKANNILRKNILFHLSKKCNENFCFQCGSEITDINDFTIEHKIPYIDSENPVDLYFNLDNIAFSHYSCNVGAARRNYRNMDSHPSRSWYEGGCRCEECTAINTLHQRNTRKKKKEKLQQIGGDLKA